MKTLKKFLTAILLCLVAAFGLTACKDNGGGGTSSGETGVYYLYENNTYHKSDYYELLSGNKWKDDDGETGTYSVSGGTITFYYTFDGETEELFDGTISGGVMCLDIFGEDTYYCKDGKTPSGNGGSSENGDSSQTATEYTVTYNANGGTFAGGETTLTTTAKNNSTLTAPDSPTRTNYTFAGWATNSAGSNKWNFSTDKVTGNLTLYATWSQESAAILSVDGASIDGLNIFMFVDKNTDSVSLASKVVCSDDSVWKLYYDKLGQVEIPTKIAADISGELLDGDNLFYIVVTSQDGVQVNVYELNVYRSYAIDVYYYDGDTLLKTETAYTGYEFTPNYTPTITGYTFNDWNYTPKVLWDDLELYVDKTANTYTVTYDVNGGDELTTTEKTATYDSDYTLTKPTRTGYTFLGWYYGDTQLTAENGKSLAVWNYAKNLTVKAKWQANEYAVTLKTNNSSAGTVSGADNYAYDSNVTITASTNSGYTWLGWYDKNDELVTSALSYKFTMGFAVTYTAKWSKTTVTKNISAAGSITSLSGKYVNGQEITVTATTNSGYTWLGWYNGDTLLTTEQSYTFVMSAENVTYTAKWTYYTVTTNTNLSDAGTYTSYTDKKVTVGTENTLTATTNNGYTWLGWYDGDTLLTSELSYTFEMPTESVTYTAKWTYYTVTTETNDKNAGTYTTYTNQKKTVGIETTLTATINNGYIWLGWYKGDMLLTSELSYTFAMPAENVTYTAKWSKVAVTLSRNNTSAGSVSSLSGKYTYGQEVTVTATTYDGYTLLGWYDEDKLLTEEESYTFIMNTEPATYIARWNVAEEMSNFVFSSTETSCWIKDVIDKTVTEIVVPDYVTDISVAAFKDCTNLMSITIPFVGRTKYQNQAAGTVFGYVFGYIISDSEESISGATYQYHYPSTNKYYHYYIPMSLKSVTVTGGRIYDYAFYNCDNLTSVTIGDNTGTIGERAFYNCSSLTRVTIGNSVQSIGVCAFSKCSNLTSVEIPNSVQSIGLSAFSSCTSLTNVTLEDGSLWRTRLYNQVDWDTVEVTDPSKTATLLTLTYVDCSWYKVV